MNANLLEVRDLSVTFNTQRGPLHAVAGVSFDVRPGACVCIVGESGCGKSATARSLLRLLPSADIGGQIAFRRHETDDPIDIAQLDPNSAQMRKIRGGGMAMVFQEPMTSFTPVYTIGQQIVEAVLAHRPELGAAAREVAIDAVRKVGISDAARRVDDYPHQMSGGMRQRAMIAMALACQPAVLIADEPTTALDVTIQSQVLRLLDDLQSDLDMGVILVTHDLAVVAAIADDVVVMYLGKVVERAPVREFFDNPQHPYSQGLLASIVRADTPSKSLLPFIAGQVAADHGAAQGCRFANRCPHAHDRCAQEPPQREVRPGHVVACWLHLPVSP